MLRVGVEVAILKRRRNRNDCVLMPPLPHHVDLAGQRVLVTGAGGFLGSRLVGNLIALGAEVHAVSRSDRRDTPGPTRWWQADLESVAELERLWEAVDPAIIYHLSGAVNGAPHLDLLLPTYHSLLTTTVNLLSVSTRRGCHRLVLIGSLEEEGASDAGAPAASPYGAAKSCALSYARMCAEVFNTPVVILRTFMSYGPGQPEWKLIPSTIRALVDGVAPTLSSGRRELDWIYVEDVVEGFVAAASASGIEGMTLDIGTGRLTSIREVVAQLVRLVNPKIEPLFNRLRDRPERPPRTADTARTLESLGWCARTPLVEGLQRTVEAYRRPSPAANP